MRAQAPATTGAATPQGLELPAPKAPWHVGRLIDRFRSLQGNFQRELVAREAVAKLYFTVVRLEDPKLLEDLQRFGVDYRGRIDSHWIQNLLLNWIVPFGVMFLVWGYLMRRMGGGPNVLRMGQSHAKIYEVDPASMRRSKRPARSCARCSRSTA